jgi:succinate-semialdehyde dehydrogenase/glutarate-semialdehyde dehydrogenase
MIQSINPYNGNINQTFETLEDKEINTKIELAHKAFLDRNHTPVTRRKELMYKLANIIEANLESIALLETIEMGRIYTQAIWWLKWTAWLIRRFADHVEEILGDEYFNAENVVWHIQYDPIGVIFGVAPRNFPYNQVLRAAIPTILAGNTIVYKHASNVPLCWQKIEDLFKEAGFPEWIYTNLYITSSQTEFILSHPYIAWTNLTGWEWAGKSVWSLAGKYLKPSVLELGGNDAFIVLEHKDMDHLVIDAVNARINNAGQRCNSSKRFIVLEQHYDQFCQKMSQTMSQLKIWDPMDPQTQLWPLAKKELVEEIHKQVQETISQWATLLTGWYIPDIPWCFYAPTVLANVTSHMTSYQQEVFGPVASIIKSSSVSESIKIANDSEFWLCACVYGDDIEVCKSVAKEIQAGMVFINNPAWSKANLPFGWIKKSGYGKENWPEWLKAFTNKKVIVY